MDPGHLRGGESVMKRVVLTVIGLMVLIELIVVIRGCW